MASMAHGLAAGSALDYALRLRSLSHSPEQQEVPSEWQRLLKAL